MRTLLAVLVLAAAGCTRPVVRVATDATFPPFHFVADDGAVTGYDLAVTREALTRSGRDMETVRVGSYAALFEGLVDGEHDVVAATTGITAERRLRYAFTVPYFITCQAIVVRADAGFDAPEDLAGARIAAPPGTTSVAAAQDLAPALFIPMPGADATEALRAGRIDAFVADEFEAVRLVERTPGLRVLPDPAALESYGLVLRQEDVVLGRSLDEALRAMAADGTLARLRARFELDRADGWPVRSPAMYDPR